MSKYNQLVFDNNFTISNDMVVNFCKKFEELNEEYKDYINSILNSNFALKDSVTNELLCPKCLGKLKKNYCTKCKKYFDTKDTLNYLKKISKNNFLIFDINADDIIAYIIETNYSYSYKLQPYMYYSYDIKYALYLKKDGLLDLNDNYFYSFSEYEKIMTHDNVLEDEKSYEIYLKLIELFAIQIDFVYLGNFDEIKQNKLFKYCYLDPFFEKPYGIDKMLFFTIFCKQSEYLYKMGLHKLALEAPYAIKDGKTFNEAFGIPKKYYKFMKENDIDYMTLLAMQIYNTEDIKILNFMKDFITIFGYNYFKELVSKYIDVEKLYNYWNKNNFDRNMIFEYLDYIRCALKLEINLEDKKYLYPDNLVEKHNELYKQMVMFENSELNDAIKGVSNIMDMNVYEDEKYIIFPAKDIDSLIDESTQMSNCVRIYCESIANYDCQIYFMRYKKTPYKSLVTIEVRNNKVIQAKTKFNKEINSEQKEVIKRFERKLLNLKVIK